VSAACAVAAVQALPSGSSQHAPAAVQQALWATHAGGVNERQTLSPFVHWQACPGVGHVAPATEPQSAAVQQSLLEMHEFEAAQNVSPPGHWQVPPGFGQISPGMGQVAQHVLVGMQTSPAMHASCPLGHDSPHAVLPPTVLQT
jgi:hypothetical protein